MTLPLELRSREGSWLDAPAPCNNVVVTSRARYARNLAEHLFVPHSTPETLAEICEEVSTALKRGKFFPAFLRVELSQATGIERTFLKELRLISREMERASAGKVVYIRRDLKTSIMVNEEDHLRVQCLEPGLQISSAQKTLAEVDAELAKALSFAYHPRLGYLTACPTNVGTGLRVSVMMHLPALTHRHELERVLHGLSGKGLTVRGFYGENSENIGDFFQISNEVTLGRSVQEIEETLANTVGDVMEKELEARSLLLKQNGVAIQDAIWRSFGLLTYARRIDSTEAMKLFSRIRLGIDAGFFEKITHEMLNRLIMEIQPGHLIFGHGAGEDAEHRDVTRAGLIRSLISQGNGRENNS